MITQNTGVHHLIAFFFLAFFAWTSSVAQNGPQMVRLAKLVIDSAQPEVYKVLLKEGIEASMELEPRADTLSDVSEKDNPTHFAIFEIYADRKAYEDHLQTQHFLQYKHGTKDMVKSLELVETDPLIPGLI